MDRGTRQKLPLAAVAFGLAMTLMVPASCIEDLRSLDWGVVEGTRVDYTRIGFSETGSFEWNLYMVVGSVPTMPDYSIDWAFPWPSLNLYWANGSEMTYLYLYSECSPGYPVFPIGNWTLMTDLINRQITYNVTDSYNYWGYSYTARSEMYERQREVDFLKRDGVLAHARVEWWNRSSDTKLSESSTTRVGLPLDLPLPPIIVDSLPYIGAGVAVLVVAFIVQRKRRVTVLAAET